MKKDEGAERERERERERQTRKINEKG